MSDSFGETAVRLCSAVSMLLGWRPGEFWKCTPAEVAAALQHLAQAPDVPDAPTLEALRRQFPDESRT